jgi:predicted RecB family nuclease
MPGEMARSDPRPSVRVTRGAGSGQHLASVLQEGRENANIDAGLGFIWRISARMMVSSHLFEAFLECSTKCWLRSRAEPTAGNAYADWARAQNEAYYQGELKRLVARHPESDRVAAPPISKNLRDPMWRLTSDIRLSANDLESHLQAVERMPSEGGGRTDQFVPYRFEFANKLTKNHKLSLAFDALVLSEAAGREVRLGKITHGDGHATLKVNVSSLTSEVKKRIKDITALLADNTPPNAVLNRHCGQCEFQLRCRKQATDKDELSLLSGLSERERKKLHGKGIFTITQLSYTFRPRRRRGKLQGKQEKFHHSLRALAVRQNKIHAVDLVDPKLDGTPVYLDVEGLPDRDFYYLIGIRVGTGDAGVQYSFWADNPDDEKRIWNEFLGVLSTIPHPRLIHYGNYETVFLKRMGKRYGEPREDSAAATTIKNATNLISFVFAQIYFPTFSNGLKDIAKYLGFQWSGSPTSGLEAIVWRHRWEALKDLAAKQALLNYNRQDCEALEIVANKLVELHQDASTEEKQPESKIVYTSDIKRQSPYSFKRIAFVFPEMEVINKAAYWDYQRERVYVKSQHKSKPRVPRKPRSVSAAAPNTTIEYPRPNFCPRCRSKAVERHGRKNRTVIDLRFMRHGIKRWITRHILIRYRCRSCTKTFFARNTPWTAGKYGPDVMAYTMYLNIELRLPQGHVDASLGKLFGLHIPRGTTKGFKTAVAHAYQRVYDDLLKRLCSGRLLHVDETSISVKGKNGYVWVLASMEHVVYFYTPTREGATIRATLKEFSGVLVSDFYAAYDAIECPQQKCLIHFIRDLNDALLKRPYDEELKELARTFAELVKPMVDTVDRRGLKRRYLAKHKLSVERFYKLISDRGFTGEESGKVVERLQKNRRKMFTFLDFDGVPWNNNNAEHAVKAFVSLRRVIDGSTTEEGLRDYLILLSLCETCKYKNVDFLDFLRSGSKNIDDFANSRWKQRSRGAH